MWEQNFQDFILVGNKNEKEILEDAKEMVNALVEILAHVEYPNFGDDFDDNVCFVKTAAMFTFFQGISHFS